MSYKITRERVRQIEADALRRLRAVGAEEHADFFRPISAEIDRHGAVMAEPHLFEAIAPARFHPHLRFLLHVAPGFHFLPETDFCHARWALDKNMAEKGERALTTLVGQLAEGGKPVMKPALYSMIAGGDAAAEKTEKTTDVPVAESYLRASKLIAANPYGEYGLAPWPAISPRGIRDKAYAVLSKKGAPMHFRDTAVAIDRAGWRYPKKAHPQTVHNELIKDNRFVLVGRGLYALREWGYEPGTVRDVIVSLFKQSGRPLERDEVVEMAREKRMVKPQTILLNLQDRDLFKRTDDGKYTLV